ncbi:reprolysin-like metallopeptidase [Methylocaldum szegediense]|uniref:Peptidyl-Asp metalloendopeptidase n=1 Tax=Methylocaldum szegediense TaxID=73780 RepID=A0ABM9HWJ9_9GAMM|nr:M12 family metallo-peptidase [Methylocaldum szegediense]CAI8734762.1 peptidyl-Asp metalloendopeptidase [Methylocaldum szegediense]
MTMRLTPGLFALALAAMPLSAPAVADQGSGMRPVPVDSSAETSGALTIDAGGIHLSARNIPLDKLLRELARSSGIAFVHPENLKDRSITARADANDWATIVRVALQGFNYAERLNRAGAIEQVIITGLNGDGVDAPVSVPSRRGEDSAVTNSARNGLPPQLARLPRDAVQPIRLDRARLMAMAFGDELALNLPEGERTLVHDNRYTHENGDVTWVGHLKDDGQAYRAVMTFGQDGAMGQITALDALYQIEPGRDQQHWLIDLRAAGLSPSPQHGREAVPGLAAESASEDSASKETKSRRATDRASAAPTANPDIDTSTPAVIDLLVLYTPNVASGKAITRINQLIALANQTFVDSRVAITLRLVEAIRVDYPEDVDNGDALRDLTFGQGAFREVAAWREAAGADLVTLIRPFNHVAHKGCGSAWLNGIDGSPLSPDYGFSVVSDGWSGSYYCSDYALAHELAHTMGSGHDLARGGDGGIFPYSRGYGVPGSFGTIMSYARPRLGLFSNPEISLCRGAPCGLDIANNALSLNAVRMRVAGFKPATRH